MSGGGISRRKCIPLLGSLIVTGLGYGAGPPAVAQSAQQDEPILLGLVTREEIEAVVPDWISAQMSARPDVEAAVALQGALVGAEVTVFFGTWCSDSGRELSRLWRALDEAGLLSPEEIRYIGVGRDKTEPRDWVTGRDLRLIPTFVVHRHGQESGRIVESSPDGIEKDLLALLTGVKSGVVTDSEDLEALRGEP